MPNLHVFIDGSWLFKACAPSKSLANRTEWPDQKFKLDFSKLNTQMLGHAKAQNANCVACGQLFISTSIFSLPEDFSDWPNQYDDITGEQIEIIRKGVLAREAFVKDAEQAGYKLDAVFHPRIKDYIVRKLVDKRYQEKQVDASVVALLVRSAITQPADFHAVVTGDADVLPAIRIAYPEYSRNVFVVTTHPDELRAEHRQSSFSIRDFQFEIAPLFLQDVAEKIIVGANVYRCTECNKVFSRPRAIPKAARPFCKPCHEMRT